MALGEKLAKTRAKREREFSGRVILRIYPNGNGLGRRFTIVVSDPKGKFRRKRKSRKFPDCINWIRGIKNAIQSRHRLIPESLLNQATLTVSRVCTKCDYPFSAELVFRNGDVSPSFKLLGK